MGALFEAATYLELHDYFRGYVLPMKGKGPDGTMSKRQRGTTAWKNHPDSFYNRPATKEEVEVWAADGCGIGVVTGPRSGVVALEIDCPELFMPLLADLPTFKTPVAKSPRGGFHLLFRHGPHVKNLSVRCPVFNDKDSPCYIGKHELASMRASDLLIALPPGPGREWLTGLSIREIEPAEVPPALLDLLEGFFDNGKKSLPLVQDGTPPPPLGHNPCPIGTTVLLEDRGRYVLLEVSPAVLRLATNKDSPLIPALVERLGGKGLRVPCPYHPPDDKVSANFWHNKSGWYLADHHFTPSHNLPVSQLCADLVTGFLERCRNGSENRYQHRVYSLRKDGTYKVVVQSFVWLTLAAEDLNLIKLPASRLPAKLDGLTSEVERVLRFIEHWSRAHCYTFDQNTFPLARPFIAKAVFALPAPEKYEPVTEQWTNALNEIDKAIYRAKRLGIIEKVQPGVKGYGGKSALYRVCTNGGNQ